MNKILLIAICLIFSPAYTQKRTMVPDIRIVNDLLTKNLEDITFQSPLILSNSIIFFYRGPATTVKLAGDFNNWSNSLSMEQTRSNLWVLSLRTRIPKGKYKYRLQVDGFWIPDPMNPEFENDYGRQKLSILHLTKDFIPKRKFPFWVSNNIYRFQYQSTNAQIITIAGDFNNWNPYSHQLTHKGAGIFEIELELNPKKIYLYSFIRDGTWVPDPNNRKQYVNDINRAVNGFYADQIDSIP